MVTSRDYFRNRLGGGGRMKKKYSFANAKPVPFGKIDY